MRAAESIPPVGRLEERLEVLELVDLRNLPDFGDEPTSGTIPTRLRREPLSKGALETGDATSAESPPESEKEPESAVWEWQTVRRTWGSVKLAERRNVYSVHGIGSPGVEIVLRRQPIDLDSAIRWRGQHCLITAIRPLGRLYLTVQAALVELSACEDPRDGTRFPAVITERYLGHEQQEPMAVNIHRRVLVTPKAVKLSPGPLVLVEGVEWPIVTPYELDPHKNEYEIQRRVEL